MPDTLVCLEAIVTFQFMFLGGPLDGLRIDGTSDDQPHNWFDFGALIYRDSRRASIGSTFDTFNPLTFAELPTPRPSIRLHTYRVVSKAQVGPNRLCIIVTHVCPSNRMLPQSMGDFRRWLSHT